MTATLWDPLADGIPASVWQPGGFQNQGGDPPGPSGVCELPLQLSMNYDYLNGPVWLDNFDQADDTNLVGTTPDFGAVASWEATADASPVIVDGAITAPVAATAYSALVEYQPPGSGTVVFNVNAAIYSQEACNGKVTYTASADAAEAASMLINVDSAGDSITVDVTFTRGEFVHTSPLLALDYCGWQNIAVQIAGSNEFKISVNGLVVNYVSDCGANWPFGSDPGDVTINLTNTEANGIRFAAVYVNNPA